MIILLLKLVFERTDLSAYTGCVAFSLFPKKKNFGKNKFSILVVIDWNILIRKINIFFPALKYIIEKAISNAFSH